MKSLIVLFVMLSVGFVARAQTDAVERLISAGVKLHDAGRYEEAIEKYKEALKIDKDSYMANYELSTTYMVMKDYKNGAKYSKKVLGAKPEIALHAYIVYGSCLDELGKPNESVEAYEEALKKFGDHYLLYFNLALTEYKQGNYKEAETAASKAIQNNPRHPTSHFLLGLLSYDTNKSSKALLSIYHFLLIEPTGSRAETAYKVLMDIMKANVTTDPDKPNQININLNINRKDDDGFMAADVMLGLLEASKSIEENKGKTDNEMFIENTETFITMLSELKNTKDVWWGYYVPFMVKLKDTEHFETFCYYIRQSKDKESAKWIEANEPKVELFETWLMNNIK